MRFAASATQVFQSGTRFAASAAQVPPFALFEFDGLTRSDALRANNAKSGTTLAEARSACELRNQ